jgi:retron-type reverse transcriptase
MEKSQSHGGSGGIDGFSIKDVKRYGVEKLLSEIQTELKNGKYRPLPVGECTFQKRWQTKTFGHTGDKGRIVQMAAKLIMEPVFEADFKDVSYGFRPKRSARQALEVVRKACNRKVVGSRWDIQSISITLTMDKL